MRLCRASGDLPWSPTTRTGLACGECGPSNGRPGQEKQLLKQTNCCCWMRFHWLAAVTLGQAPPPPPSPPSTHMQHNVVKVTWQMNPFCWLRAMMRQSAHFGNLVGVCKVQKSLSLFLVLPGPHYRQVASFILSLFHTWHNTCRSQAWGELSCSPCTPS